MRLRWLTATAVLDVNTLAGADKFGNIFVSRLPQEVSDDVDDAQLLSSGVNEVMALNGAPCKADELVQFHVGELVTSLQKVSLGAGHDEVATVPTRCFMPPTHLHPSSLTPPFMLSHTLPFRTHLPPSSSHLPPFRTTISHHASRTLISPPKHLLQCSPRTSLHAANLLPPRTHTSRSTH